MKKFLGALLLSACSMLSYAQEFVGITEGKDYTKFKVEQPIVESTNNKPIVVELFWYGCPHCNVMRPISENFVNKQKDNIVSIKYPASFGNWETGARMFFTYQEMNILDKMHVATFNEIHNKNSTKILFKEDARNSFLKANGVDVAKFNMIYNSFSMSAKIGKSKEVMKTHRIENTPVYVVYKNGFAYQTSPALSGSYDKTINALEKIVAPKK